MIVSGFHSGGWYARRGFGVCAESANPSFTVAARIGALTRIGRPSCTAAPTTPRWLRVFARLEQNLDRGNLPYRLLTTACRYAEATLDR